MHELGVTFYVVKDVKKVAQENKVDKIDYVKLEIGEVSGVVHDQLIDCWNWARKKEAVTEHAKMYIEIIYVFLTIFLYLLKCPQSLIL